ncbi:hypothetical protein ACP70R_007489 [Stipagrostis hirtigluma subsp. patula]
MNINHCASTMQIMSPLAHNRAIGTLTHPPTTTMANTNAPAGSVGPAPFRDVCGEMPPPAPSSEGPDDADAEAASASPAATRRLCCYQGTWVPKLCLPGVLAIQRGFTPRPGDVVLANPHKCGTTWLKALAFATMARGVHPPTPEHLEHPLLRLNPHDCVPFMDMLFATGSGSKMDALPSPRLMATHMHHALLPASISENPQCKIVYICIGRDPKDMVVSLWHFVRKMIPDLSFSDMFEHACEGVSYSGPIWDHVLGYWNASKASPKTVLFLRYEDMLRNPVDNTRKLARFVGQPFSPAEEEGGVAMDIVRLCSFEKMKNLEVNKSDGSSGPLFTNNMYFRKGAVGDWTNHMTPEMARRLDTIVEEKLRGSGLSFV